MAFWEGLDPMSQKPSESPLFEDTPGCSIYHDCIGIFNIYLQNKISKRVPTVAVEPSGSSRVPDPCFKTQA